MDHKQKGMIIYKDRVCISLTAANVIKSIIYSIYIKAFIMAIILNNCPINYKDGI